MSETGAPIALGLKTAMWRFKMWIFLKDAFFSITRAPEQGNLLLVRARFRGDIERCFPEADVFEDSGTDYRYRTLVPHKQLLEG